jgi:hypothetical protein
VNFLFRVADPSDFVVQKEFVLDFGPSTQNERLDFALVGPSGDFEVAVISPKSAPAVRHFPVFFDSLRGVLLAPADDSDGVVAGAVGG